MAALPLRLSEFCPGAIGQVRSCVPGSTEQSHRTSPTRRAFPDHWQLDLQAHPAGRLIFLRRTNEQGEVGLLGHSFAVDKNWPHRLIRAEVDLDCASICFYALRRREPTSQPLLRTVDYQLPKRRFRDRGH